ncbi:MAG TPA: DUF898 family protein, partial [Sphingomicrobium sp.]
ARWNQMSFGPLRYRTNLNAEGLKLRWAGLYLGTAAILGVLFAIGSYLFVASAVAGEVDTPGFQAIIVTFFLLFYVAIPLLILNWYAKYYRKAADALSIGELEFGFDASTWDWLKLFVGNIALAVVTLGFGIAYWGYRNWAFMVRHMHVYGSVDASALTQSTTHAPGEAEGLADAFDIGAI